MAKQIRALEERLHVIDEMEKNLFQKKKKINAAKRLGLPPSTLNLIILKNIEFREPADENGTSAKKRKTSKMSIYSELERVLFASYEQVHASNIPVERRRLK
ncbi:hypothetical protein NPIL_81361 [Nephila pilipes]|uniref:Uncharacterized protein n=1 Tax=Nephila pilipes TaxID=299642 RepID=A0A8X6QDF0_NEPPI|nr:hypothetical protein NPIL_81361 [Nephila pilipes]